MPNIKKITPCLWSGHTLASASPHSTATAVEPEGA